MPNAILKTDGTAVAIEDLDSVIFDMEGFLVRFTADVRYSDNTGLHNVAIWYRQQADFKDLHKERVGIEGYYQQEQFINYLNGDVSIEDLIAKYKFNFDKLKSSIGDSITITRLYYGQPYEYYYKNHQYTFNLATLDGTQVKNYKKAIFDNLKAIDFEVDVPADILPVEHNLDENHSPYGGNFFWKNFGDTVNNWTISDLEKQKLKKVTTAIALRINYVIKDILPLILSTNAMSEVDGIANDPSFDMSGFSFLEKAIFLIKRSWGYYYQAGSPLVQRNSFDPVFSITPDYDEYYTYYFGIVSFYNICSNLRKQLTAKNDADKLNFLIQFLPNTSFGLFPFAIFKYYLINLCQNKEIGYHDQEFVVKIAESINIADTDNFLDFLIDKGDGVKTYFEKLYGLLSDNILKRMVIPNWIVDSQTYRKAFIFSVFNAWKNSKYDFTYIPPGITPIFGNINPNAFFLANPTLLNTKNVLTFISKDDNSGTIPIHTDVKFTSVFSDISIKINTVTEVTKCYDGVETSIKITDTEEKAFGTFHLYNPITFAGYQVNQEFSIPQKATVPAFLFHYIEEYGRLSDFDAKIALGITISIDVLLAYFTGGTGLLEDLSYLRRISQFGQALEGTLPAAQAVEVWRGLEDGNQVITLTASTITNFHTYLIATETDAEKRKVLQRVQEIFLSIVIFSATVGSIAGSQAVKKATEVLDLLSTLPANTLTADLKDLLTRIKGDGAVTVADFERRINNLILKEDNNILTKYISLTQDQKIAFKNAFENLKTGSWNQLNKALAKPLDNWLALYTQGITEAKDIGVLTKQGVVDGFLRFYLSPDLRAELTAQPYRSRIKFLDEFGTVAKLDSEIFARLESNPKALRLFFDGLKYEGLSAEAIKKIPKDALSIADVKNILRSTLEDVHLDFLTVRNSIDWKDVTEANLGINYNYITDKSVLQQLVNRNLANIANDNKASFLFENRLYGTTKIYSGDILLSSVEENFISGNETSVNKILAGSSGVTFTEPNYGEFESFAKNAFDDKGFTRNRDTELKYIYNFLKNHYSQGDRFEISLSSTLYSCKSCQRYLKALKTFVEADGKSIEITFISHPDAKGYQQVQALLNN